MSSMAPELALLTTGDRAQLEGGGRRMGEIKRSLGEGRKRNEVSPVFSNLLPILGGSYYPISSKEEGTSQNSPKIHWILLDMDMYLRALL